MKNSIFISFFFLCAAALHGQTVHGTYYSSTGKGHCIISITKDNTYYQQVSDCTYGFITQGKVTVKADTLMLIPSRIVKNFPEGKKTEITDSTSYMIPLANNFGKYLIKNDTLVQLKKTKSGYHPSWELELQPEKTTRKKR